MSNLHRLFAEAQITDSFNQTSVWSHPFYCAFCFVIIGQHHQVAKKNARACTTVACTTHTLICFRFKFIKLSNIILWQILLGAYATWQWLKGALTFLVVFGDCWVAVPFILALSNSLFCLMWDLVCIRYCEVLKFWLIFNESDVNFIYSNNYVYFIIWMNS